MQVTQAINDVLELKQGYEYKPEQLLGWLNECEQMIWMQLINNYEDEDHAEMPVYGETDYTKQLMIPEPFSKLYIHYLEAQMCYWNRETTGFVNAKERYTQYLNAYIAEYIKTHKHKGTPMFKGVHR